MSADGFSFSPVPLGATAQDGDAAELKCEPLLIDMAELSRLTTIPFVFAQVTAS